MSQKITKTIYMRVPGVGVIKVSPQGGRRFAVHAPDAVEITDRRGRPLCYRRRKASDK